MLDTWFSSALWPFSTLGITDADSVHATFEGGVVYITGGDQIKVKVVTYSAVPLNKIDVTFTLGELRSANE